MNYRERCDGEWQQVRGGYHPRAGVVWDGKPLRHDQVQHACAHAVWKQVSDTGRSQVTYSQGKSVSVILHRIEVGAKGFLQHFYYGL